MSALRTPARMRHALRRPGKVGGESGGQATTFGLFEGAQAIASGPFQRAFQGWKGVGGRDPGFRLRRHPGLTSGRRCTARPRSHALAGRGPGGVGLTERSAGSSSTRFGETVAYGGGVGRGVSCAPPGLFGSFLWVYPALKRWAIFLCPRCGRLRECGMPCDGRAVLGGGGGLPRRFGCGRERPGCECRRDESSTVTRDS